MKHQRYTVLGGRRGTVKHCWQLLTDEDGYQARCAEPHGTEHSHHDCTAREAVARRSAFPRENCEGK